MTDPSSVAAYGTSAFTVGLTLGFGSILSIGPNNLLLLKEGFFKGRKWTVATTVFASYLILLLTALRTEGLAIGGSSIRLGLT